MALTLNNIFSVLDSSFMLQLIAGKSGLTKTVSWIYYTEDPETIEFIRGGELAITTGLNLERQKQNKGIKPDEYLYDFLKNFIDSFIAHNASGLIINTGKYIQSIPKKIIEYCNENNFSLFTMPWEIHTIDLMQEVGNMISADTQNAHNLEKLFYNAIFKTEEFDSKQLKNTSFADAKYFSIALLALPETLFNSDAEKIKRYVLYNFNHKMSISPQKYCCFIQDSKIIYIVKNDNTVFASELEKVAKTDKFFKDMKISLSDSCSNISDLSELHHHATVAMSLSKQKTITKFDNLGFFKILADVKNEKTLYALYNEIFGKLDTLEEEKREDYLKTLKLFLKYSGNIKLAAEKNFIHRNTAIYRIKRLEEILGIDLSNGENRFLVHAGLYIRDLLFH